MQHWIVVFLYAVLFFCQTINASIMEVTTYLHGSAEFPCTFSFVSGPKSLYVSWEKREHLKSRGTIVHNLRDGGDDNEYQDPEYRGRTELSRDLSRGKLDLILTNVTFSDEGIYYCRAANLRDRGDIPIRLSINRLRASDPSVTFVTSNNERRLKCFSTGIFREPQIEWIEWNNSEKINCTSFGTLNVIDLDDGTRLVESVLEYNITPNVHYFCYIKEGRLRRSARAVISDGSQPVTISGKL
ncbi:butyrophilin subfamily 1 member A1-like [Discoglossus pictus]